MIVFLKSDGTIMAHLGDSIRQGSANTNHLYVVAPISTGSRVSVAFTLPNGIKTSKYLMSVTNSIGSVDVSTWLGEESDQQVSLWDLSIGSYATQVAGNAVAQIFIEDSHNTQLATASYQFQIEEGVTPQAIDPDEGDISTILSALTAYTTMVSSLANQEVVMDVTDATQGNIITYKGTTSPYTGVTAPEVEDSGVGIDDVATNIDSSADADYDITISLKNKDGNVIDSTIISKIKEAVKATLDGSGNTITSHYGHSLSNSESGGENTLKLKSADNTDLSSVTIDTAKKDDVGEINTRFVDAYDSDNILVFKRANNGTLGVDLTSLVKYILNQVGFDATSTATILSSIQSILYNQNLQLGTLSGNSVDVTSVKADNATFDNVTISGRLISEDVENMLVKDRLIVMNNGLNALGSSQLSGMAIITSGISTATYPKTYNAFGILYNGSASSGDSVQAGFGVVTIAQGSDNTENYTFTFTAGQNYPIALRNGLVDGKLVKYDDTTHTLTDSGKAIDDLLYEGKSVTATEDQVLGNVDGELGFKTLANPMLYKYVTHPSSDTAGKYLGCFSLHVDENLADGDIFLVTFNSGSLVERLVVDLENNTFDLYDFTGGSTLLVSDRNIISVESDGSYRLNFSYSDLSSVISYNTLRTYTMTSQIVNAGNGVTIIALDSYIDGQVQDVIDMAFLLADTKVNKMNKTGVRAYASNNGADTDYYMTAVPNSSGLLVLTSEDGKMKSGVNTQYASQPTDYNDLTRKDYVDDYLLKIVDGD